MDLPVKALTFVVVLFTVMFLMFDVNRKVTVKQIEHNVLRSASQGTLDDVLTDYNNYSSITTANMFEEWLINFINTHDINISEVRLNFKQIQNNPPLFLVYVEGYDNEAAILNNDIYVKYISGSMIITDD